MTSPTPVLEFVGISKSFEGVPALVDFHLSIARGETVVLIGPSGCGKTTVLRSALGLAWPDRGQVRFKGTPISPDNIRHLRHSMGYVVQEGGLFPHLIANANITLMARHLRWARERIEARVDALVALTRFPADALRRYPHELSGGQRQRVGLMRALMLDPDLLLLDEPLGAIDPLVRADLQTDLAHVFAGLGQAVLLVTHDLAEAAFFADRSAGTSPSEGVASGGGRVVLMRAGRSVQQGPVADLVNRPADPFVTRFVAAQPRWSFGEPSTKATAASPTGHERKEEG